MKKYLIFLMITMLLFSCETDGGTKITLIADGEVITQKREVADFNKIVIAGPMKVILEQSKTTSLEIETYESILENFISSVDDSVLYLYIPDTSKNNNLNFNGDDLPNSILGPRQILWEKNKQVLNLTIHIQNLKEIVVAGDVDIKTPEKIIQDNFTMTIVGQCDLDLNIESKDLDIDIVGSANCNLKGSVDNFSLDCAGAGKIGALELLTKSTSVNVAGLCTAKVNAEKKLTVNVAGLGRIYYKGNPENISIDKAGVGTVQKIND